MILCRNHLTTGVGGSVVAVDAVVVVVAVTGGVVVVVVTVIWRWRFFLC